MVAGLGVGSADPWNSHGIVRTKRSTTAQDLLVVITGCTKSYQRRTIAAAGKCYDRALATVKYHRGRANTR